MKRTECRNVLQFRCKNVGPVPTEYAAVCLTIHILAHCYAKS